MLNMIDANARRARVLELARQAVLLQIQMWDLQKRLEGAMLDGAEMGDAASDEVLDWIKTLAAGAPVDVREVYDAITDEHVTDLFRVVDAKQDRPLHAQLFDRYKEYMGECKRDNAAYLSYSAWKEWKAAQ